MRQHSRILKKKKEPELGIGAHMYEVVRAPRSPVWERVIESFFPEAKAWHACKKRGKENEWVAEHLSPKQCIQIMLHAFKCCFLLESNNWKNASLAGYNKNWSGWYLAIHRMEECKQSIDWHFRKNCPMNKDFIEHVKEMALDAFKMRMSVLFTVPRMESRGFDGFPKEKLAQTIVDILPEFYSIEQQ